MKLNKKGISMISMVITIIAIIILTSISINVGYRYLEESENKKIEVLLNIVSDCAYRRQNDKHIDPSLPYVGYPVISTNLEGWSDLPEGNNDYTSSNWFVLDAVSAATLGVVESERYITNDISNASNDDLKLILVNYDTGDSYLVSTKKDYLTGNINLNYIP